MTDRIDALERLNELRRAGALSDTEFEDEKGRVMADAVEAPVMPLVPEPAPATDPAPRSPRRSIPVAAIAALGLALAAAGYYAVTRPEAPAVAAKIPAPAVPVAPAPVDLRALPAAEQTARAALAAFGKRGGATLSVDSGDDYGDGGSLAERVAYKPGQVVWASFGPVLLSAGEVADASHFAAGKIAAHYLRVDGDRFALVRAYPKAVVTGSFGAVGDWRVRRDIDADPVIVAEGGGTWQGYSCSMATLTALRAGGPVELATVRTSYDNGGAADGDAAVSIEGKITNVVPGRSFDVAYTGTRSFTETYLFDVSRYELQGESQLEQC